MRCAECGEPLAEGARFCASCGASVATVGATAPAEGAGSRDQGGRQRKVATLLFADLVGFTTLNEQNDPEVIEAVVSRAFARLSAEIERYEGTVEKFAGDAMLAVFGVPTVHEDDAERAVRAALEMQQVMAELRSELEAQRRPTLGLRIGIETGEVLADQRRATDERDRMVTGDAVNTAARLEQSAAPGAVVVGPRTHEATRALIEYAELAPMALKGKSAPIQTWQAIRVRTRRGGVRPVLGLEAALIGRDEELGLLKETVRRTVADGKPHLVTVVASAGVGKSRLTWELEKYLDGLPDVYHWRKGRCLAYAQTSYSALAEAIAADASVLDDDAPDAVADKLARRLADLAPEGVGPDVERAVRVVIGLPADGAAGRDELFEAWRVYLELIARRAPLVLVLEDIHWADEGLLDFIEYLARWSEAPILLLCLTRHELLERRQAWGGGLPNATSIVLEPLGAGESEQLVDSLLGAALPAELRRRVVEVSEGNPLFTEELVRLFVDRGVVSQVDGRWQQAQPIDEIEIPQSIQALLAARLDSLPPDEKRLSQDAAVVGRIFWDRLLAHLAGQSPTAVMSLLRRLRQKELVVPREPSTLADAAEFAFRHVLIRDVAYESLPKLERARKHREVAEWAEEQLGDRAQEVVELLAAHYWSALRYEEEFASDGEALDALRRKTMEYATAAGRRASDVAQQESATHWMRIAVDQSRRLGSPPVEHAARVLEYLELAWGYENYQARLTRIQEALAALSALPGRAEADLRVEARLHEWIAYAMYESSQDADGARAAIRSGLELLEGIGPCEERAALLHRLGWIGWRAGPAAEAPGPLEAALAEAREVGSTRYERWALHDLGLALTWNQEGAQGLELLRESMRLAQEAGDRMLLLRCYVNVPSVLSYREGFAEAVPMWEEAVDRARRSMDRHSLFWAANNLAEAYHEIGRLDEALALHHEVVAAAAAIGLGARSGGGQGGLASMCWTLLQMGRREEAREIWRQIEHDEPEPQAVSWWVSLPAALAWHDDPARSVDIIAHVAPTQADLYHTTLVLLARMALRTDRADGLQAATANLDAQAARFANSPVARAARWARALASGDSAGTADMARELEDAGYPLQAADAYADAAWLAERHGAPTQDWAARAAALYARCSAVPLLDPVPVAAD